MSSEKHPEAILVVEDNPVNAMVTRLMLQRKGFVVEVAENGARALELLQRATFGLVLMDVSMPVMDGLEATRKIRSGELPGVDATIPVVGLTAHNLTGDKDEFLEAGMDRVLTKPIEVPDLDALIQQYFGEGEPERE
ncbi:MAG: response regulator [Leptospiraceae bacterium]|nr:response regulator [Leptospiraceae bacterium]